MSTDIPTPLKLAILSASFCVANIIIFPQVFPSTPLTKLFLIFTSINFGVWGFWKVAIFPYWFSPFRHYSRPKGALPLLGHGQIVFQRPSGDSFLRLMNEVPNEGMIRFAGFFNVDWLLLTDQRSLSEVLVHKSYDYEKPKQLRSFLRMILGDGLILVEGDEHKFQRKHLSPAFSFRNIKELYPIFWSKAVELTRGVAAEVHANPEPLKNEKEANPRSVVEINHWANKVTMDIIGVAALGRELNALTNSDDELIKNYEEILEPTAEKAVYFTMNLFFPRRFIAMLPWALNATLEKTTGNLRAICHELVREKKSTLKGEHTDSKDILSLLLVSNNFADDMIVDQLLTFLAAGHETTSSAFTWATYLLAEHPEIQTKLREEIRANIPSPFTATADNAELGNVLESLPYLNAVCNEVTRLYPPVPTTIRIAVSDTTIGTQFVPKGTRIYISPWAINRSSALWGANAAEFCPERWIDPETGRANNTGGVSSNYSIMTFLHGPRSCIGERFAKAELKALIAVFCGTFSMEWADTERPIPAGAITAKPHNGMRIRLQKQDGW
ncbi:hypothetical protein BP6252_12761 [Coleophoma cylindrospora]|uniref:Cytochrome P450 n=1 Tax=Coleophoma cylindrospora TaxID=1849047 RepID=A0A3D8QE19_9HELO|nr:hypothetical protein BP6252_12761 [Coleophoma cylindrospora]